MCFVQLQKLGVIPFDEHLDDVILSTYKGMWANNGDYVSRQYTGTAAMKVGHVTPHMMQHIHTSQTHCDSHRYTCTLFNIECSICKECMKSSFTEKCFYAFI